MPSTSDILQFAQGQLFATPALPKVSFAGKTVVVTGANIGLGFECAKHLVGLNVSTLVLGCRDVSKGEAARKRIESISGSNKTTIHVWQVDMAKYASIKAFNEKIKGLPRLDVLLVNAGISTTEYQETEGLESTLTVNVVGAFLLALLALPSLESAAAQTGEPSHLTITGSSIHIFAAHDQLQKAPRGKVFATLSDKTQADMPSRYFLSKLMVLLGVQELAARVSKSKVIINCPNPGWCKTELFRQNDGGAGQRNILRLIGRTGEVGARTLTSAIVAGPETHGHYLSECQVKPASAFVVSKEGQEMQKELSDELFGILEEITPGVTKVLGG